MNSRLSRGRISIATLAALAALSACEDVFRPQASEAVTLSFTTSTSSSRSLAAAPEALFSTRAAAERALEVQKVDLVLAKLRLKGEKSDDECEKGSDPCAEFRAGPVLVSLPLARGTISPFTTLPPPGTYKRLDLHVHQPGKNDRSTESFFAANPGWPEGASVRVRGLFDAGDGAGAQPFDIFLRTSAKLRHKFDPAIVIGEGSVDLDELDLVVEVDVARWFRNRDGSVIDPRALTTDPRLLREVERNIHESFRALRKAGKGGKKD